MRYDIVSAHPLHPTIARDVMPSPLLIQQGTRGPVDAYEASPATDHYRAFWRMRDDSYDPPGTEYRHVRVNVINE